LNAGIQVLFIYLEVGSVLDWSTLVVPGNFWQRLSRHDHFEHSLAALGHVKSLDWLQKPWRLHRFGQLQALLCRRR